MSDILIHSTSSHHDRVARRFACSLLDDALFAERVLAHGGTLELVEQSPPTVLQVPRTVNRQNTYITAAQQPVVGVTEVTDPAADVNASSFSQLADYSRSVTPISSCGTSTKMPCSVASPGAELSPTTPAKQVAELAAAAAATATSFDGPVVAQKCPITPNEELAEEDEEETAEKELLTRSDCVEVISNRLRVLFDLNAIPAEMPREQRAYLIRVFNYSHENFTNEKWNCLTHLGMGVLAVPAAVALVVSTAFDHQMYEVGKLWRCLTVAIYGMSTVFCLFASAVHHGIGLRAANWKMYQFLRRLDHVGVMSLISGTYLPPCFCVRSTPLLTSVGVSVVLLNLASTVLEWKTLYRPDLVPPSIFLAIQTCVPVIGAIELFALRNDENFLTAFLLFAAGGVAYLIGAVFYAAPFKPLKKGVWSGHESFHVLINIAAICHYIAVSIVMKMGGTPV